MSVSVPFRQIHLDFHTGPDIPGVGSDFSADEFAETMQRAHVNSVTLFAKCHHGHLYYATRHPARHPHLKPGLDLLREQVEALHRRGIRAPIYLSAQCDEYAATTHPEWRVVNPDGTLAGGPVQACWHIVDMSSPYQDYLADQIAEVIKLFKPLDELFLDMCWDQPSVSRWAIDGMRKAGLNPEDAADRATYAHRVSLQYMTRYKKLVDDAHRKQAVPVWFNSRPLANFAEEKRFYQHAEIEALPTGGWGYMYFPLNVRFVRTFGLPCLGMTGRFHKSWADFGGLKPEAALMYECSQMLAHGAACSVGDQLHPRGQLDAAVYDLIGKVYAHVEACEPWCRDARAVTDIAVVRTLGGNYHPGPGDANEGVVRALQQLGQQFDFVPADADFAGYALVIVPECVTVDAALTRRLEAHVKRGGALLLSGAAGFTAAGEPLLNAQGVAAHGESPFQTTYLRFDGPFAAGVPATDHVLYERGRRVSPAKGARGFVPVVEPYFDRTWEHFSSHFQTPPDRKSKYVAAVQNGRVITVSFPVFKAYATHGNLAYRHLIRGCIEQLLPNPLVRLQAPSFVEITVTSQARRTMVHLLSYVPQRRTPTLDIVEEPMQVRDIPISLRLKDKPKRVVCQPDNEPLAFTYRQGRVEFVLPELCGHRLIVVE
jgi:hypothetical protein